MKIFETHAHLDLRDFDKDRARVIEKCRKVGVEYLINIGYNQKTSNNAIELAKKYDFIYASVGYHPHNAVDYQEDVIRELAVKDKVVALGEIGLDYYRNLSPRDVQREVFQKQIELAKEFELPIIVHDRDAHDDCFEILKEQQAKDVVFHCFSGNIIFAEKVLAEDWKISIAGTITFKNNYSLKDVVRMLPDDSYFIETDSPYLAPVPFRGKRNAPFYLPYVIEEVGRIRMQSPKKVASQTYDNAVKFFFPDKKKKK